MKVKKVCNIDDFRKADRRFKRKEKFLRKWNNFRVWFYNNQEMILILSPIIIGAAAGGTKLIRVVGRNINLRKEERLKNLYCYDRSLGHYWKLKRELKNSEWVTIDKRRKSGERLAEILSDMKVLK